MSTGILEAVSNNSEQAAAVGPEAFDGPLSEADGLLKFLCELLRVDMRTTKRRIVTGLRRRMATVRKAEARYHNNLPAELTRIVATLEPIVAAQVASIDSGENKGFGQPLEATPVIELTDRFGNRTDPLPETIPFNGYCVRIVHEEGQVQPQLILVNASYCRTRRYLVTVLGAREKPTGKDEREYAAVEIFLGGSGRIHLASISRGNRTEDVIAKAAHPQFRVDTIYFDLPATKTPS